MEYELIWSEKFICNISDLDSTVFNKIIKELKVQQDKLPKKIEFGQKCLLINKLHKTLTGAQIGFKSKVLQVELIGGIEESLFESDFGRRMKLDDQV